MRKITKMIFLAVNILILTGCAYTMETGPNGMVNRSSLSIGIPATVGVVRGGGYYAPSAYGYGYSGYYAPIGWGWGGGYWGGGFGDGHHHHHHDSNDTINNYNNDGDVNIGDGSNFDNGGDGGADAGTDGGDGDNGQ